VLHLSLGGCGAAPYQSELVRMFCSSAAAAAGTLRGRGLIEISEEVLIQALATQAAVEAYKTVLHRFAGCDVVLFDPELLLPDQ
jgi:hypothetical protein